MLWRILQKEVVPGGAPPSPRRVPVLGVGWEDGPGLLFF